MNSQAIRGDRMDKMFGIGVRMSPIGPPVYFGYSHPSPFDKGTPAPGPY